MFTFYSGFKKSMQERGLKGTIDYARGLGLDSFEFLEGLPMTEICPTTEDAKAFRREIAKEGFSVPAFSSGMFLIDPKDVAALKDGEKLVQATGSEAEKRLMHFAEIASALECPILHHTLYLSYTLPNNKPQVEQVVEAVVESAARIADFAKPLGVKVIYEDQGAYFNRVKDFGLFFNELKNRCSNVGVCGDIGNILFVGESPVDFFRAYASDIAHVHLKDYRLLSKEEIDAVLQTEEARQLLKENAGIAFPLSSMDIYDGNDGSWIKEVRMGEGEANFPACMKILREAGYSGAFSMEACQHIPGVFEDNIAAGIDLVSRYF